MEVAWRNKRNVLAAVLTVLSVVGLAGCNNGGSRPDPITYAWYGLYYDYTYDDWFLEGCGTSAQGPRPGCNFYADGYKIMDYEDPYYYSSYAMYYDYWYYTDSYGYDQMYTGWAWQSPNGIIYDEWGYALNETGSEGGRDIIADAAEQEEALVSGTGKAFAEKYALSEEVGIRIARTLNEWARIGKKRGRTEADVREFTERLYGIDAETAMAALASAKTGDMTGLDKATDQIAQHWNTDAETSRAILKNWYGRQLEEVGLK